MSTEGKKPLTRTEASNVPKKKWEAALTILNDMARDLHLSDEPLTNAEVGNVHKKKWEAVLTILNDMARDLHLSDEPLTQTKGSDVDEKKWEASMTILNSMARDHRISDEVYFFAMDFLRDNYYQDCFLACLAGKRVDFLKHKYRHS